MWVSPCQLHTPSFCHSLWGTECQRSPEQAHCWGGSCCCSQRRNWSAEKARLRTMGGLQWPLQDCETSSWCIMQGPLSAWKWAALPTDLVQGSCAAALPLTAPTLLPTSALSTVTFPTCTEGCTKSLKARGTCNASSKVHDRRKIGHVGRQNVIFSFADNQHRVSWT